MNFINRPFKAIFNNEIRRPILPVILINPADNQTYRTIAIIDTGSDACVFPGVFATMTGHKLEDGKPNKTCTASGETTAYSHKVSLDVDGYKIDNIYVDFMSDLPTALLGVRNFLENFILTIDYDKKIFSLHEIRKQS